MDPKEKAVREAAAKLATAIADARTAGFEIGWPRSVDGLNTLAISATGRAIAVGSTIETHGLGYRPQMPKKAKQENKA